MIIIIQIESKLHDFINSGESNRDCISFALLCSVIGPEITHHLLDQSDAKLKPITTSSPEFSHALGSLLVLL